jgi:hypothetical protein
MHICMHVCMYEESACLFVGVLWIELVHENGQDPLHRFHVEVQEGLVVRDGVDDALHVQLTQLRWVDVCMYVCMYICMYAYVYGMGIYKYLECMHVCVCTASILPYQFFDGLLLLRGLLKPHSQYVCMYVCMYVCI